MCIFIPLECAPEVANKWISSRIFCTISHICNWIKGVYWLNWWKFTLNVIPKSEWFIYTISYYWMVHVKVIQFL